jgi:hypothetical protein
VRIQKAKSAVENYKELILTILVAEKGIQRSVAGENRYQYELRWGHLQDEALHNLRIGKCHHYYDGIATGAQLKRKAVLASQWAARMRLSRTNCIAAGNEFGPHNTRWSRPRRANELGMGPELGRDVQPAAARLLNIIVRRIKG